MCSLLIFDELVRGMLSVELWPEIYANEFHVTILFPYPLKTSEFQSFYNIFRMIKNGLKNTK